MSSKFFGITKSLYETIKFKLSKSRMDEFNNVLKELKKISGEEKFNIHFNKGKSMTPEQGIEFATTIINYQCSSPWYGQVFFVLRNKFLKRTELSLG